MKKILIVFLVVFLSTFGANVIADTASKIGKKVDGEAIVSINGKEVSNAVIIQGKSYAPVRDIAEGLGATVTWKGSEGVNISTKVSFENDEDVEEYNAKIKEYLERKSDLESKFIFLSKSVSDLDKSLDKAKKNYVSDSIMSDYLANKISNLESELENEKIKLLQYEKELSELEQ